MTGVSPHPLSPSPFGRGGTRKRSPRPCSSTHVHSSPSPRMRRGGQGVRTLGRTGGLGWIGVTDVNGGNMSTTRLWRVAVAIVGLVTGPYTWPLAAQGVPIGANDISGVVTGPNGPESGV